MNARTLLSYFKDEINAAGLDRIGEEVFQGVTTEYSLTPADLTNPKIREVALRWVQGVVDLQKSLLAGDELTAKMKKETEDTAVFVLKHKIASVFKEDQVPKPLRGTDYRSTLIDKMATELVAENEFEFKDSQMLFNGSKADKQKMRHETELDKILHESGILRLDEEKHDLAKAIDRKIADHLNRES